MPESRLRAIGQILAFQKSVIHVKVIDLSTSHRSLATLVSKCIQISRLWQQGAIFGTLPVIRQNIEKLRFYIGIEFINSNILSFIPIISAYLCFKPGTYFTHSPFRGMLNRYSSPYKYHLPTPHTNHNCIHRLTIYDPDIAGRTPCCVWLKIWTLSRVPEFWWKIR